MAIGCWHQSELTSYLCFGAQYGYIREYKFSLVQYFDSIIKQKIQSAGFQLFHSLTNFLSYIPDSKNA